MLSRCSLFVLCLAALAAGAGTLRAGSITVPNASFETPPLPADPFELGGAIAAPMDAIQPVTGVNPMWVTQGPTTSTAMGNVEEDTGIFVNRTGIDPGTGLPYPDTITNADGAQLAFMNVLSTDQVRVISQDLTDVYQVGQSYTLTVGVAQSYFEPPTNVGDDILIGLYYVDTNGNHLKAIDLPVDVSQLSNTNLQYFSVTLPTVSASDPWAGQPIDIDFRSDAPDGGFADLDNVTLTAAPEPATLAILGVSVPLLLRRRR